MFLMKTLLISFISLLLASCQPPCCKKRACCAVYDQTAIKQSCQRAVCEEEAFAHFKTDPFFSLLYPPFSYEEGLVVIEKETSLLESIRKIDAIGGPELCDFGRHGQFSLPALRHLYMAQQLRENLPTLSPKHIVLIGAGDGGLCQILQDIYHPQRMTLIDLPEPLALARKVLKEQKVTTAHFLTPDQVPAQVNSDLVVSDFYFSQYAKALQERLITRIFSHARAGFFSAHLFPKYFGKTPLTPQELKKRLETKVPLTMNEGNEHYYFIWDLKK